MYYLSKDSRAYRVHPFGFWWCCLPYNENDQEGIDRDIMSPLVTAAEENAIVEDELAQRRRRRSSSATSLQAVLSPFMAHSVEREMRGYDSVGSLSKADSSNRATSDV